MKKKQRLSDLFYDNRFLLVFSVLAAIAFWLVVVVEFGVEVEREIKGVPVSIDYEKIENDMDEIGHHDFHLTSEQKDYIEETKSFDLIYKHIRIVSERIRYVDFIHIPEAIIKSFCPFIRFFVSAKFCFKTRKKYGLYNDKK